VAGRARRHEAIFTPAAGVVNATIPTDQDTSESVARTPTLCTLPIERTVVDVRIGVTQAPREINLEVADDTDRAELKSRVEAALSGAVDVLWLTDRRGREVGIAAAKIAYVEVGRAEGDRKIGFGG
jgi:hypothetical protein